MDDTKGRNRVKSDPIKCNAHRGHIRKEYTFLVQYSNSQKGELFVEKKKNFFLDSKITKTRWSISLFFLWITFSRPKKKERISQHGAAWMFFSKVIRLLVFQNDEEGRKEEEERGREILKKKNEEPHLSDWDVMGFKWPESLLTRKRASERERPHTGDRCSRHQAMLRKKDRGSLINNKEKLPSRYRTWLLSFGRWWPQSCRRRRRESHKERHGNNKSIHARDDEKR